MQRRHSRRHAGHARPASVWRYRTVNPVIWPLLNNVRSSDAVMRWKRSLACVEANP